MKIKNLLFLRSLKRINSRQLIIVLNQNQRAIILLTIIIRLLPNFMYYIREMNDYSLNTNNYENELHFQLELMYNTICLILDYEQIQGGFIDGYDR